MKTIVCISRLAAGMLAVLLAACDKATEPLPPGDPAAETLHTIAYLKTLCDGKERVTVTQDIVIRGFIVANDLYGEYYNTLVVEDETGGISIAAEHPSLADAYPWGAVLTVRCNGLVLCDYGGKVMLGTEPGEYGAGRIPREELPRYFTCSLPGVGEEPRTTPLSFEEVGDRHIDTRVRFDNVRFEEPGVAWCDVDPETGRSKTTERTIVDASGNRFVVRTAGTCVYAREPVPSGTGSLYGVIDYFAGKYSLHVTNREAVFATAAALPTTYP